MDFVPPHFHLSIYPNSNTSIIIIVTFFWHPGYLFLSNQGASRYIRYVNIHQLKQCFGALNSAEVQGVHWQSFHQRSWDLWREIENLFWTARSVFARKFQPEENFYGWACLCAGGGILKAIPEDFSLCDFSARLTLFSVAKMMCTVCKSRSRCCLGRLCAWCCAHLLFPPPQHHTAHHWTTPQAPLCSPCVTFNLIFSPQFSCISTEAVTALTAPWSVWSRRKPLPWGISDKPTYQWNLLSKSW